MPKLWGWVHDVADMKRYLLKKTWCLTRVCFFLYAFLAIIIVALHGTARPKFELRLSGCEPWRTNTPQHAERSVSKNIMRILTSILLIDISVCRKVGSIFVLVHYELSTLLSSWYDSTHRLRIAAPHAAPVLGAVLKVSRNPGRYRPYRDFKR